MGSRLKIYLFLREEGAIFLSCCLFCKGGGGRKILLPSLYLAPRSTPFFHSTSPSPISSPPPSPCCTAPKRPSGNWRRRRLCIIPGSEGRRVRSTEKSSLPPPWTDGPSRQMKCQHFAPFISPVYERETPLSPCPSGIPELNPFDINASLRRRSLSRAGGRPPKF